MALSATLQASALGQYLIQETASNSTANTDVRSGATNIYFVQVDNSAVAAVSYLKLYDNANPTVGTTAPDVIIKVPASTALTLAMPTPMAMSTALSFATVTTAGTAGTTSPTGSVIVRLLVS